jgi:hypothetical protein
VSQQRQQQLIAQQQQRIVQYRDRLNQNERIAEQRNELLRRQNRVARYRFQEEYFERLREQRIRLQSERNYDYDRDPYFYTAPVYRYYAGNAYYETNEYGANLLRQAVNNGYAEGLRAGQADQQDGWNYGYQDSYAYQDANYGYDGYYLDQAQYNYYFRQGFQRGYDDGYYGRYQFGAYNNGAYVILSDILTGILNFQSLR